MTSDLRRKATLGFTAACASAALFQALRREPRIAHSFGLLAAGSFLIPTLVPNCAWNGPVMRRLPTGRHEVWLTIDDGPDPQDTPEILDVLARHEARASFFAIGRKVRSYPETARAIVAAGHDLQNHTWSHPAASFWAATPARVRSEVAAASEAIREVTGQRPRFFRAPAGLANSFVHAAAHHAGLRMAGWSARGFDGVAHRPARVVEMILRDLRPGSIVLLHEGPLRGLRPGTRARTLEKLLVRFSELGYRTVLPGA